MLDLETQIRNLADAAERDSEAVPFDVPIAESRPWWRRRVAFALVAAPLVLLLALYLSGGSEGAEVDTRGPTVIDDPLAIDLEAVVATSGGYRLAAFGEIASLEFGDVPGVREAAVIEFSTYVTDSGPHYRELQKVLFETGHAALVEVTGRLGTIGSPDPFPGDPIETVRFRGPDTAGASLVWTTEFGVRVSSAAAAVDQYDLQVEDLEALRLDAVQVSRRHDSGLENFSLGGDATGDVVLAGIVRELLWRVHVDENHLAVSTFPNHSLWHRSELEAGQDEAAVTIVGFFGMGAIAYGHTPTDVHRVVLVLEDDRTVRLPTVRLDELDRQAFAVPIDDRLDPVRLDLLRTDGTLVASLDLVDLPPFLHAAHTEVLQVS